MKLEYVDDPTLLTRIKRSLSHISVSTRIGTEKVVTTNLFVFEKADCSKIEMEHKRLWNFCLKVMVALTGKKFVVTQEFSFGDDWWTLYRVVEAEL